MSAVITKCQHFNNVLLFIKAQLIGTCLEIIGSKDNLQIEKYCIQKSSELKRFHCSNLLDSYYFVNNVTTNVVSPPNTAPIINKIIASRLRLKNPPSLCRVSRTVVRKRE